MQYAGKKSYCKLLLQNPVYSNGLQTNEVMSRMHPNYETYRKKFSTALRQISRGGHVEGNTN